MKYIKHTGTTINVKNNNITAQYGTTNSSECKAVYCNISGWIGIEPTNHQDKLISDFSKYLKHFIKAHSIYVHPSYLYTFVDMQISESLFNLKLNGFFAIEITIMLNNTINFKTDSVINNGLLDLIKAIETKVMSFEGITITKHKKSLRSDVIAS